MKISIIIPVFNEADVIEGLIRHLLKTDAEGMICEVLVADGGSTDDTCRVAEQAGATVIKCSSLGRAIQMNEAAGKATGDVLYFLHADTFPPHSFSKRIIAAVSNGAVAGCFRLQFDYRHWFLQANAWFTRFDYDAVRFGDQSLFVTRSVFFDAGKFNESLLLLEDQEIITRIRNYGKFKILSAAVTTSARKYLQNGIYKLQAIFLLIYLLYRLRLPQPFLFKLYRRLIS
ncbi:MAG: TIGR04283 family arsenosugar biosynthesis glycosyltransferase [Hymenobacteraceae bacterium]|nr:TIGR04283 family arsenosugar biosynthesis glycosyltransferase [Hymenobacteraceae bacterium]MDX5396316.1 TIGR04283 family arsenosugar biosynthesis glycosyltransferase [Hymenobacteraceae bacterium]MDX5512376.1 TIGR04283 family arsenosugar biosynthesis glycosyltransferase [Hymenobacteraceae bacterium]